MIVQRISLRTLAACNPTKEKVPRNKRRAKIYKLVLSAKEVKKMIMSSELQKRLRLFSMWPEAITEGFW